MPLPDVSDVCVALDANTGLDIRLGITLPKPLSSFRIRMPGGISLEAKGGTGIPNPGDVMADILAQVNSALVPLKPIFDIIDILLLVVQVFDAVKSLNPISIGKALVKLIAKVDVVAQFVPPLSIPLMVVDFLDAIIVLLGALKANLTVMLTAQLKLDAGQAAVDAMLAGGDPFDIEAAAQLQAAIDCGKANLEVGFAAMTSSAQPLNRLLALVSGLGEAIGLPKFGPLEMGASLEVAITPIDALLTVLGTVRVAIPV